MRHLVNGCVVRLARSYFAHSKAAFLRVACDGGLGICELGLEFVVGGNGCGFSGGFFFVLNGGRGGGGEGAAGCFGREGLFGGGGALACVGWRCGFGGILGFVD